MTLSHIILHIARLGIFILTLSLTSGSDLQCERTLQEKPSLVLVPCDLT